MDKILSWLLEEGHPAVRYYALKHILGRKKAALSREWKKIMEEQTITGILSLQDKRGWWTTERMAVTPIYKNTFWQLYFLSQAGLSWRHPGIDLPISLVAAKMQKGDGAFCTTARHQDIRPCMQGLAAEMLIRLGYGFEPYTEKLLTFICNWVASNYFRCTHRHNLNCPWGATKILKALNCMPQTGIGEQLFKTKMNAVGFLLKYNIVKAAYPRKNKRSRMWFQFGFPRNYSSDVLEVAACLADAGLTTSNHNFNSALDYIYSKHMPDGRWRMEFSLNGKMLVDFEKKAKPSKWVTFLALKTLYKSGYLG